MASSSKYTSVENTYELDDHDRKTPAVSVYQTDSTENLVPRQDLAPVSHPQWHSGQPDNLGEEPLWEFFFSLYDLFLCFIAFVLILKTSLVIFSWHKDRQNSGWRIDNVSPYTLKLLAFNEQVVTAFTIVFITIMTTVTRRLALYKAQQGAYMSDLEQLQASVSLPSVIKMVFYLQKFSVFSFMLVGFWSFYYLGSQAARREYRLEASEPFKTMMGAYPNDNLTSWYDGGRFDARFAPSSDLINSMQGRSKGQYGVDYMGSFLIPDPVGKFYALKRDGTINNTKEYKVVPSSTSYAAYAGLALSTERVFPPDEYSNQTTKYWGDYQILGDFSLDTTYFKVYCDSLTLHPFESFPSGVLPTMSTSVNMTNGTGSGPKQLEIWQRWDESFRYYFNEPPIATAVKKGASKLTCNIVQPRVKVGVHCNDIACTVNKLSCPYTDPTALHNTRFQNATFAVNFFSSMLLAGGVPQQLNDTSSNTVISNMNLDLLIWYYTYSNSNSSTILQQILDLNNNYFEPIVNTWYNLGINSWPTETKDVAPENGFTPVSIKGATRNPRYAINWIWIGVDYFSGFLLLAAAIYSFWLRKHTLAPDIFGFVSSLTRDNPHFPVPPGGSTLDGLDRTRALRNMQVRIGDIAGPHGEVGRVGFVPVDPQMQASHLTKERKYL